MYNVRRILCVLTVLMFAASFADMLFFKKTDGSENTAEAVQPVTEAFVSSELPPVFQGTGEKFVAHRGYSAAAPENTALAFELAGKAAFWGIETDIAETYDNEFVCLHDDTLERTTDGTGYPADYTYASLRTLTITDGANIGMYPDLKIPSMVEFLNICVLYNCVPIIEIKSVRDYDKFLQTIYNSNLQDRCVVTGGINDLKEIRARDENIMLMVIGYSNVEYTHYVNLIGEISGNRGILYNYPVVTQEVVDEIHAQGIFCGVWSLDTAEEAQQFMDYGVEYVVTNEIPGGTNLMINDTE